MRIKANTYKKIYFQNAEIYREVDSNDDLIVERYTLHVSDGQKKIAQLDTQTGNSTMYRYQYGNNLGSVGLELNENAEVISCEEYYPFGGTSYYAHEYHIDVPLKRYKYCGKEQDEETGLYYYGARYYLPWLCRFASVDPKALEYVHQSSYVFADNNPVVKYDVNGEGTNGDGKDDNLPKLNNAAVAISTGTAAKPKIDPIVTPKEQKKQEKQKKVTDNNSKVKSQNNVAKKESSFSSVSLGGKITGSVGFSSVGAGLAIKSSKEAIASVVSGDVTATKKLQFNLKDLLKFEGGVKATVEIGFTFSNSTVDHIVNGSKIGLKVSEITGINILGTGVTIKTEYNTKSNDRTYKIGLDVGIEAVIPFYRKVLVSKTFEGTASEQYKTLTNLKNYPLNGGFSN